jgi:hypothetical protein
VGTRPRLPRRQRGAVNAIGEILVMRRDFGKKDIGLPHAPHAAGRLQSRRRLSQTREWPFLFRADDP